MSLILFHFETGEPDCPYWTIMVIAKGNFDADILDDILDEIQEDNPEMEFEDVVENAMNQLKCEWESVDGIIPACTGWYEFWK